MRDALTLLRPPDRLVRCWITHAATWIACGMLTPGAALSQPTHVIDASKEPSCAGCAIVLTKVAALGNADNPEFPGVSSVASGIAVDSHRRFFVTNMSGDMVLVYDSTGKYLRSIGRNGGGPGEFRQAMKLVVGKDDSLYVLGNSRVNVFAPALTYVRSVPLAIPTATPFVVLPAGQIAVTKADGGRPVQPIDVVGPLGVVRSFGTDRLDEYAVCRPCLARTIAPSRIDDHFWSIVPNKYEVEEWTASGQLARRVSVRGSSWFVPWTQSTYTVDPNVPPVTRIRGFFEDARGQLWIAGLAPIPSWTPPPPRRAVPSGGRAPSSIPLGASPDPERVRRLVTIIEVLDPATNRVVVSQHFAGRSLRLLSAEYVAEVREDEDGVPVIDIWSMTIKRP